MKYKKYIFSIIIIFTIYIFISIFKNIEYFENTNKENKIEDEEEYINLKEIQEYATKYDYNYTDPIEDQEILKIYEKKEKFDKTIMIYSIDKHFSQSFDCYSRFQELDLPFKINYHAVLNYER
jgi:hypothetical protein